jgi:hypothetical protein
MSNYYQNKYLKYKIKYIDLMGGGEKEKLEKQAKRERENKEKLEKQERDLMPYRDKIKTLKLNDTNIKILLDQITNNKSINKYTNVIALLTSLLNGTAIDTNYPDSDLRILYLLVDIYTHSLFNLIYDNNITNIVISSSTIDKLILLHTLNSNQIFSNLKLDIKDYKNVPIQSIEKEINILTKINTIMTHANYKTRLHAIVYKFKLNKEKMEQNLYDFWDLDDIISFLDNNNIKK